MQIAVSRVVSQSDDEAHEMVFALHAGFYITR